MSGRWKKDSFNEIIFLFIFPPMQNHYKLLVNNYRFDNHKTKSISRHIFTSIHYIKISDKWYTISPINISLFLCGLKYPGYPCRRVRPPIKKETSVLDITLNCIWLCESSSGALANMELPLYCHYSQLHRPGVVVLVWAPSTGQINQFKNHFYSKAVVDTI